MSNSVACCSYSNAICLPRGAAGAGKHPDSKEVMQVAGLPCSKGPKLNVSLWNEHFRSLAEVFSFGPKYAKGEFLDSRAILLHLEFGRLIGYDAEKVASKHPDNPSSLPDLVDLQEKLLSEMMGLVELQSFCMKCDLSYAGRVHDTGIQLFTVYQNLVYFPFVNSQKTSVSQTCRETKSEQVEGTSIKEM